MAWNRFLQINMKTIYYQQNVEINIKIPQKVVAEKKPWGQLFNFVHASSMKISSYEQFGSQSPLASAPLSSKVRMSAIYSLQIHLFIYLVHLWKSLQYWNYLKLISIIKKSYKESFKLLTEKNHIVLYWIMQDCMCSFKNK